MQDLWLPKIEAYEPIIIGNNTTRNETMRREIYGTPKECPPSTIPQNNSLSVSSNNSGSITMPQLPSKSRPNHRIVVNDETRRIARLRQEASIKREALSKSEISILTPEITKPNDISPMVRKTDITFEQTCQEFLETLFSGLDAKEDPDYITLRERMITFRKMEKEITNQVTIYEKSNPSFKKVEKTYFYSCFIRKNGRTIGNCELCDHTPERFLDQCEKCHQCDPCSMSLKRAPGCKNCSYCRSCADFNESSYDKCMNCKYCKNFEKCKEAAETVTIRTITRNEHKAKQREKTLATRPIIQSRINYFNKVGHYHKIKFLFVTLTANPKHLSEHSEDKLIEILEANFDKFSDIKDLDYIASVHSIEYTKAGVPHLHGIIRYDATPFNTRVEDGNLKQKSISATDCKFKKKNYIPFEGKRELCEPSPSIYKMLHKPKDIWNTLAYIAKECSTGIPDLIGDYNKLIEDVPELDEIQSPPSP